MTKKPLVIAMALAFSSSAYAEQTQQVTEFDEVVVSATRVTEKVSETSRSVAVVSEEQLQELQPASVAQALKNEANVNVSNGPRASSKALKFAA